MRSEERKWVFISFLRHFIDSRPSRWTPQEHKSRAVGNFPEWPCDSPVENKDSPLPKHLGVAAEPVATLITHLVSGGQGTACRELCQSLAEASSSVESSKPSSHAARNTVAHWFCLSLDHAWAVLRSVPCCWCHVCRLFRLWAFEHILFVVSVGMLDASALVCRLIGCRPWDTVVQIRLVVAHGEYSLTVKICRNGL
jgi:hypothetical protein